VERTVPALAHDRNASIARLILDGRTIAALVLLKGQDTVWAWKIAYDESVARASPGVHILLHANRSDARRPRDLRAPIHVPPPTIR